MGGWAKNYYLSAGSDSGGDREKGHIIGQSGEMEKARSTETRTRRVNQRRIQGGKVLDGDWARAEYSGTGG